MVFEKSKVVQVNEAVVRRGNHQILGPITISFSEGERWVILGPNGAGKSTLLKLIGTEIFPTTGQIEILGKKLGAVDVFDL